MRLLITAGPTQEPIDPVRYIGNRSSGRMGAALAEAALRLNFPTTLILGPVTATMPSGVRRIDLQTATQMRAAVLEEFPAHDALIMAAAVADYRPATPLSAKIGRGRKLLIECEPTEDIIAEAGRTKRAEQRTVGFSLETRGELSRSRDKLRRKQLDLIVYNPMDTMNSEFIESVLIWPDGRELELSARRKSDFAALLLEQVAGLFS